MASCHKPSVDVIRNGVCRDAIRNGSVCRETTLLVKKYSDSAAIAHKTKAEIYQFQYSKGFSAAAETADVFL